MLRPSLVRHAVRAVDLFALEQRGSVMSYLLWSEQLTAKSFGHAPREVRFALEERADTIQAEYEARKALEDEYEATPPPPSPPSALAREEAKDKVVGAVMTAQPRPL